jgi:hypothetical protein
VTGWDLPLAALVPVKVPVKLQTEPRFFNLIRHTRRWQGIITNGVKACSRRPLLVSTVPLIVFVQFGVPRQDRVLRNRAEAWLKLRERKYFVQVGETLKAEAQALYEASKSG